MSRLVRLATATRRRADVAGAQWMAAEEDGGGGVGLVVGGGRRTGWRRGCARAEGNGGRSRCVSEDEGLGEVSRALGPITTAEIREPLSGVCGAVCGGRVYLPLLLLLRRPDEVNNERALMAALSRPHRQQRANSQLPGQAGQQPSLSLTHSALPLAGMWCSSLLCFQSSLPAANHALQKADGLACLPASGLTLAAVSSDPTMPRTLFPLPPSLAQPARGDHAATPA